jgi:signal peptidase I
VARPKRQPRPPQPGHRPPQKPQGIHGLLHQVNQTSTGRFISSVVMALLIVIPVRIFALQGYHIPSGSMENRFP